MSILFRDEISEAEAHRKVKCPKCSHVVSATNEKCPNCGHDLAEARKAKFAQEARVMPTAGAERFVSGLFDEAKHPRGRGGKWVAGMRVQHRDGGAQAVVHGPEVNGKVPVKFTDGSRDPEHVFHVKSEDLESLERPRQKKPRKHGLVSQAEEDQHKQTEEESPGDQMAHRHGYEDARRGKPARTDIPPHLKAAYMRGHKLGKKITKREGKVGLASRETGIITEARAMPTAGAERFAHELFDEALHPRDRRGEWSRKGLHVEIHERPPMFEKGQRVVLPDGREGTVQSQSHARGGEQHYLVHTTPGTPGSRAWKDEVVYHGGRHVKRETALKSVRDEASKRFKGLDSHDDAVARAEREFLGDWQNVERPGRVETKEVAHSDLRLHPDEVAARTEEIAASQAKAEKAGSKVSSVPAAFARAVTNTAAVVPDEWKVANGYGEFVNPDHKNPGEGDEVRVMPTHPTHAGRGGVVVKSAYSDRASGRTLADVRLDSGEVVSFGNNEIHSAERNPWVRLTSGTNVEHMIYHYLTGHPVRNIYAPGTPGFAQWSYGMEKAGFPQHARGDVVKRPANKSEREALLRKITQALAARGDEFEYERLLSEACDVRAVVGALDEDEFAVLAEATGFVVDWNPVRHPRGRGGRFAEVMTLLRSNGAHDLGHGVSIRRGLLGTHVRTPSGEKHFLDVEHAVAHAVERHSDLTRQASGPHFLMRYTPGGERGSMVSAVAGLTDEQLRQNHDTWQRAPYSESRSSMLKAVADESARRRGGGSRGSSKAQALVDAGLADDLADARAQLADMGEGGRFSPGGEGGSRHQRKLERMKVGDSERFGAVAVRRHALGFTVSANGVSREAPRSDLAAGLISAHFQGRGLTLEHPERVAARERLTRAGEEDPSRRGAGVADAVHDMYGVLGRHPLTREEALASGRHSPGGERSVRRGR